MQNRQQVAVDQRGLKTLVLWLAWLAAAASMFIILYHKVDVFSFIREDMSRITWIISGLFLFSLLVSFIHTLLLTAEWFRGYRIERVLKKKGLSAVKPKRRVVDRFIAAVQHINSHGAVPDVAGLVDVEFAAHHRGSRFVGLLGNLLITMGLIGTVLGMTMTLSGLNGALAAIGDDQELMLSGLSSAMSGMGVAFYTTLLGSVLGGVLLRVFAWITDNSIDGLQDLMMRSCLVYAAADLVPSPERDVSLLTQQIQSLEQRMQALRTLFANSSKMVALFNDEVMRLNSTIKASGDGDDVMKAISVHRYYSSLLRSELRMQQRLRHKAGAVGDWWNRLRGRY
ncbi:MAG: MotA/TolQ/ExbB proton channel family protein [Mariprofundales bacterium]|nr:MotA/TolQ/ExbB proton channel family protein [Mariprofundales bacterium]